MCIVFDRPLSGRRHARWWWWWRCSFFRRFVFNQIETCEILISILGHVTNNDGKTHFDLGNRKMRTRGVNGTRAYLFHFISTMERETGTKRKRGKFARISSQLFVSLSSSTHTHTRARARTYWNTSGRELPLILKYDNIVVPFISIWTR